MSLLYRMGTGNGSGSNIKPYTVNFECASGYIGQTITMKQSGQDNVSGIVGSDGKLTLYPMYSGEWECSCYSSVTGTTTIKTIDLSYWGVQPTVTFEDTPNGATVTPTDDVQTWLHCANVWNKSYTTISEVVADTTTLNTLIANENANDYLVRSTTFATDICSNESAMTYIGLNDYCANKLLADSTWFEAICNSAYFEKVLNVKVPTMTSNTEPYGEAYADSIFASNFPYYQAFDDAENTFWQSSNSNKEHYIQYKFTNPVNVRMVEYLNGTDRNWVSKPNVYGSNNGVDWKKLGELTNDNLNKVTEPIYNNEYYLYYRLTATPNRNADSMYVMLIRELQFYGREEA